jgi:hypothetical protein
MPELSPCTEPLCDALFDKYLQIHKQKNESGLSPATPLGVCHPLSWGVLCSVPRLLFLQLALLKNRRPGHQADTKSLLE